MDLKKQTTGLSPLNKNEKATRADCWRIKKTCTEE